MTGHYKLRCDECHEWTPEQRKFKGCDGPSKQPIFRYGDIECFECPGRLITPDIYNILQVYGVCKSLGCLPCAGGVLDQTNHFIEAAYLVEATLADLNKPEDDGRH